MDLPKARQGMGLRGYTLSETQAPFPLCLDLGGRGLRGCYRNHMMDEHYVLCPRGIRGVNSQSGGGGVIWLSLDAAHFSCSLSDRVPPRIRGTALAWDSRLIPRSR